MKIIHNGRPHTYVRTHMRGDVQVVGHWRPAPIGAGDSWSGDPNVMGDDKQGFAPPTNPEPRELWPGKQS